MAVGGIPNEVDVIIRKVNDTSFVDGWQPRFRSERRIVQTTKKAKIIRDFKNIDLAEIDRELV